VGRTGRITFVAVPNTFAEVVTRGQPLPQGRDPTPMLDNDQFATVRPGTDAEGDPALDVQLTAEGARIFDEFAARSFSGTNGGVQFAIVLDAIVQAAVGVNTDHFGGAAQIDGRFDGMDERMSRA
jgi:preprotein translocase subunit SecD